MNLAGGPFSPEYRFTIFIPTYNRRTTLSRTIRSVQGSLYLDFEVIIVDDGSADKTYQVVANERNKVDFPLTYIYQRNSGKAGAHNTALQYARGEFFITLDAGDLLLQDALSSFLEEWEGISDNRKPAYAGVSALCLREDMEISGSKYPAGLKDASFLELVSMKPLNGEKRQAIRTEVMRMFTYPRICGEKHIRPNLILLRMAHHYILRYMNKPVQVNVREEDGITANIHRYRMNNPGGFRLYYLEEITVNRGYYTLNKLYGDTWRYIRFSLHARVSLRDQLQEVHNKVLWLLALPQGVTKWLIDRIRMGHKYSSDEQGKD